MITCPPNGTMEGAGAALFLGGFTWECVNGELHIQSGFCASGTQSIDANGNVTTTSGCKP